MYTDYLQKRAGTISDWMGLMKGKARAALPNSFSGGTKDKFVNQAPWVLGGAALGGALGGRNRAGTALLGAGLAGAGKIAYDKYGDLLEEGAYGLLGKDTPRPAIKQFKYADTAAQPPAASPTPVAPGVQAPTKPEPKNAWEAINQRSVKDLDYKDADDMMKDSENYVNVDANGNKYFDDQQFFRGKIIPVARKKAFQKLTAAGIIKMMQKSGVDGVTDKFEDFDKNAPALLKRMNEIPLLKGTLDKHGINSLYATYGDLPIQNRGSQIPANQMQQYMAYMRGRYNKGFDADTLQDMARYYQGDKTAEFNPNEAYYGKAKWNTAAPEGFDRAKALEGARAQHRGHLPLYKNMLQNTDMNNKVDYLGIARGEATNALKAYPELYGYALSGIAGLGSMFGGGSGGGDNQAGGEDRPRTPRWAQKGTNAWGDRVQ